MKSKVKKALGAVQKGVRGGIYRLSAAGKKIYGKPKSAATVSRNVKPTHEDQSWKEKYQGKPASAVPFGKRLREGGTMAVDTFRATRGGKVDINILNELRNKRHGIADAPKLPKITRNPPFDPRKSPDFIKGKSFRTKYYSEKDSPYYHVMSVDKKGNFKRVGWGVDRQDELGRRLP